MQIPIPNGSFGHEHSDCQPTTTRPYLRPKPTKQWGWAKIRASFQGRSQANDNLQHIEPSSPVDVRLANGLWQRPRGFAQSSLFVVIEQHLSTFGWPSAYDNGRVTSRNQVCSSSSSSTCRRSAGHQPMATAVWPRAAKPVRRHRAAARGVRRRADGSR